MSGFHVTESYSEFKIEERLDKLENNLKDVIHRDEMDEFYKKSILLIEGMIDFNSRLNELEEKINNVKKHLKYFKDGNKEKETFDFMTAVKYMGEGKKVRRKSWKNIYYKVCNPDSHHFELEDFNATDWEIYE